MNRSARPAGERFIDIDGRRVRVRVTGEGAPVLLVNGLGANVATWTPLLEQLAGFETITFDAPGTGLSQAPRAPYRMSRLADVAERVLDELGHDRVDVLGYSLGGAVAQHLAAHAPERVRRLVLVSTSCGVGGVPGSLRSLLAVSTPVRHYTTAAHRVAMRMVDLAPAEKESGVAEHQIAAWHQEAAPSVRGYMLQMAAFSTFHSLPWLERVDHPTLVMSGAADRLVPMANSAILAAHLPRARLRIFQRWGHYLLHDPTSGAGAAVSSFLGAKDHAQSPAWRLGVEVDSAEMAQFVRSSPRSAHLGQVTGGVLRLLYPPPDGMA